MPEDPGNTGSSNIPDPTAGAKANLRDTAKWLATTLAALAAVILAGTSFTGLAHLHGVDLRLALAGGAVAIIAVLLVIALLLRLLISETFFFGNLADPMYASVREELDRHAIELLPPSIPNIGRLLEVRRQAIEAVRTSIGTPSYAQNVRYLQQLREVLADVTYFAQFEAMRQRLLRDRIWLFSLTLIGLAGLATLVVAVGRGNQASATARPVTNIVYPPPTPTGPPTAAFPREAARNAAIRILLIEAIRLNEKAAASTGGPSVTLHPMLDLIHGLTEAGLMTAGEADSLSKDLRSNAIEGGRDVLVHLADRAIDGLFPPEATPPSAAPPISITVSGCCARCRVTTTGPGRHQKPTKPEKPKKPVVAITCPAPAHPKNAGQSTPRRSRAGSPPTGWGPSRTGTCARRLSFSFSSTWCT